MTEFFSTGFSSTAQGANIPNMKELTPRGARTRENIITHAIDLMGDQGFYATSFQQIADMCGVTQPAIFKHFSTKNDLLAAIRDHITLSNHIYVDKNVKKSQSALNNLEQHFLGNISWALKERNQAKIIFLTYYFGTFDKGFRLNARSAIKMGQSRILHYVSEGKRTGIFTFAEDSESISALLHDQLFGLIFKLLSSSETVQISPKVRANIKLSLYQLLKVRPE